MIFLHGRGSSGRDGASVADALGATDIAFVSPNAARGTWYPHRFLAPLEANEPWLGGALGVVETLIQDLLDAGQPIERIGLLGFSQGGCLALEYASRRPRGYGFVAGLSAALIGPIDTPRVGGSLSGLPLLIGCAAEDPHIPIEYVESSARSLEARGAQLAKLIVPGSAHNVFGEELDWIGARIAAWRGSAKG